MNHENSSPESLATAIPPEILNLIITNCRGRTRPVPEWRHHPIPYTHVCRYWRAVIHATPSLWTSFYVGDLRSIKEGGEDTAATRDDISKAVEKEENLIQYQLARTGDLDIVVVLYDLPREEILHTAAVLLGQHRHRWRHVFLGVAALHALLLVPPTDPDQWTLSNLKTLRLLFFSRHREAATFLIGSLPTSDLLLRAPRLVDLTLVGVVLRLRLPWSQLNILLLDHPWSNVPCIQHNLRQCTSLTQLNILDLKIKPTGSLATFTTPIILPRLRSLIFRRSIDNEEERYRDGSLLAALRVPSLTLLHLSGPLPATMEQARTCLVSSAAISPTATSGITDMVLTDVPGSSEPLRCANLLLDLLDAAGPHLARLRIEFACPPLSGDEDDSDARHSISVATGCLLRRLGYDVDGSSWLCPNLTHFELRNAAIASPTHIGNVISSRITAPLEEEEARREASGHDQDLQPTRKYFRRFAVKLRHELPGLRERLEEWDVENLRRRGVDLDIQDEANSDGR